METTETGGSSTTTTKMAGFSSAFKSSAVAALLCYVLINLVLNLIWADSDLSLLDVVLSQNTAAFSLITRSKQDCKVVLLGSSVMERPFSNFTGSQPRYTSEPILLEKALWKKSSSYIPAINYCVEASLISDQYILLKKYILNRPKKPIVVLGLAPRDFSDSRWPNAADTGTFKTLVNPKDIDVWPHYVENSDQFLHFFSNHISLLFRFRRPICSLMSETIQILLLEPLTSKINFGKQTPLSASAPQGIQINQGAPVDLSHLNKTLIDRFQNSYLEYIRVYSSLKEPDTYRDQFKFLKLILELCRQKDAQLILVNVPVASTNKSLLPPGFYEKYLSDLATVTAPYKNVIYIDAPQQIPFSDEQDFWDAAHLNDKGGQKLTELICPPILKILSESRAPSRLKLGLKGN